jgi:hypothetical protein
MTCIAGLIHRGTVYLAGDSASGDTAGYFIDVVHDPKIFQVGPFTMGFTTSWRMGQLLQHQLQVPPRIQGYSDEKYLAVSVINAVRSCLKEGGFAKKELEVEHGGTFLIGYEGKLYRVEGDYQVCRPREEWAAIGCGYQFALGALYATRGWADSPKVRLEAALNAAARYSAFVRGPILYLEGPPPSPQSGG